MFPEFKPSPQQAKAIGKISTFLNQEEEKFFLLGGYAGTGKSTVIFQIVEKLLHQRIQVVLTAPTNKAVGVLKAIALRAGFLSKGGTTFGQKSLAASKGLSVDCMTIHQLLGLGMLNKKNKKVLGTIKSTQLPFYDVVFLDECSMVSQELWDCIQKEFSKNILSSQPKLILMGDPAQLNPVNEKKSPTFAVKNRAILTQVVRQSDSPILNFINLTRQATDDNDKIFLPHSSFDFEASNNKYGTFKVSQPTLLSMAIKKISESFDQLPDSFRVLCWTNKKVDYYNRLIRAAIYGQNTPRFLPGERLITKEPIVAPDQKTVMFPTSTEITVKEATIDMHDGYQVWILNVVDDEQKLQEIFVLHEKETKRYSTELERHLKNALNNSYLWKKYYKLKEKFAQVKNCYALTIHNAQGSTFESGGIDGDDLFSRLLIKEKDKSQWQETLKEYHRLWYVAASRFQKRILFTAPDKNKVKALM